MKTMRIVVVVGMFFVVSGICRADKGAPAAQPTSAATKPLQLALVAPDIQMVPENENISGLRLEIYGRNANVNGLDLGIIHASTGDFNGVGLGLVDLVGGHMHGAQWSWLYSDVKGEAIGWPSGLVTHVGGDVQGLQTGLVSLGDRDYVGIQLGLYDRVGQHISGCQLGIVNRANSVKGVQLGIVNLTNEMNGLQIGLWNQIDSKQDWNIIPFVNWKF